MIALLRLFVDILLLRRGPQDLPAAPLLLAALLILNFLVGALFFDPGESQASAWAQTAMDLALQMILAALVLQLRGFRARVLQTLSAFAGTGLLLSLILVPVVAMLAAETVTAATETGRMLFFALLIWSLAVDGHIFRHALSSNMITGTALAVALFIVRLVILEQMWSA